MCITYDQGQMRHDSNTAQYSGLTRNKAGYTATLVACGWAGAIFELTRAFGLAQYGQRIKIKKKSKV